MKVDMHVHTHHSIDGLITRSELKKAISSGRIDAVALTDHNTASAWKEFSGLNIIKGIEKTIIEKDGNQFHLLIYFAYEDITSTDFYDAIDAIKEQDAIASIAHPFDTVRHAPADLKRYAEHVDALECLNARICTPNANKKAKTYAKLHNLAKTAGSDAHHHSEIGTAYVEAETDDIEEFRKLLLGGKAELKGGLSSPHVHTYSFLRKRGLIKPDF